MHQAFVALVHEFDRVFDREDVFAAGVIDVIQQSRQGGGLAGSCWTRHQHQPPGPRAGLQHHRRQVQQFNAGNRAAKGPQAGGIAAFLAVDVHAEACNALEAVGAVQFPGLLQRLALAVVQHREDQLVAVLLGQGAVRHRTQFTAEAAVGRLTGGEVQITATALHQLFHQVFDHQIHDRLLSGVVSGNRDTRASLPADRHRILHRSLC